MDLQSFIQSGLLEAYVLGQCTSEERKQVERMASDYTSVRTELASIEASLERYAAAHAVSPPEGMKSKIMDQIQLESNSSGDTTTPTHPSGNGTLRVFQIAAFLLAAATAFLFFKQKDMGTEQKMLQLQVDSLQQQLIITTQLAATPDPIRELLCDPATQRILVSDGKGINTVVYFNPRLQRMAYDPVSLPAAKLGSYYQFWAIVNDKPVSLGMQSSDLCGSVRTVENPVAFAISEEPNPEGNATPTLVLAVGKAG